MSGIVPWKKKDPQEHPVAALRDEMNRLFDNFWSGDFLPERFPFARAFPTLDVTETEDAVLVKAEIPGLEAKDIEVTLSGDVLTLRGEKKEEKEENEKNVHHREVRYGAFSRSIQLPAGVEGDKVSAECKKGVLRITLPKTEKERAKKIVVKGESAEKK